MLTIIIVPFETSLFRFFRGPKQFPLGKVLIKPNFSGIFGNQQEKLLKHHYAITSLLYCFVIAVLY